MLLRPCGVEIEGNVFALLIELQPGRCRQTLRQGGLAVKLMGELPGREHRLRVRAGGLDRPVIERQRRRAGLALRLICQCQQLLFGRGIVVAEGNVGSGRGRRFQRRLCAGFSPGFASGPGKAIKRVDRGAGAAPIPSTSASTILVALSIICSGLRNLEP